MRAVRSGFAVLKEESDRLHRHRLALAVTAEIGAAVLAASAWVMMLQGS